MILFAMTNIEIIVLVVIGLLLVGLVGIGLIRYTKIKMENELDEFSTEPTILNEITDEGELLDIKPAETISHDEHVEVEPISEQPKEPRSEIEILLEQMQSDLSRPDREIVHTFEEEQEEKSIISYQELKAMKEHGYPEEEIEQYERDQETHSVLSEPDMLYYDGEGDLLPNDHEEPAFPILEEEKPYVEEHRDQKKHFANSDFISPVYGKMDTGNLDYPKIPNFKEEFHIDHNQDEIVFDDVKVKLKNDEEPNLEHTFDLGPMSDEIKKNDEFLQALKEFRNNLE